MKLYILYFLVLLPVTAIFSQSIVKDGVNTAGNDMVNNGMLLSWNIGTIGTTFFNEEFILEGMNLDMEHKELELESGEFTIYPNPFIEGITIKTPVEKGDLSMRLMDVQGRTVQHFKLTAGVQILELDHLTAGVYLLKFFGARSGYYKTSRIVKLN